MTPSSPINPSGGKGPGKSPMPGLGQAFRQLAPTGLSLLVLLIFLLLLLLYGICTQYIQPDQFAVKQVDVPVPLLTGSAGIHTNIYDTGIQWRLPGCEKFLVFPKSVRAVTLHRKGKANEDNDKFVRYEEPAHIQTSDGFFINLDLSILYRVINPFDAV